MWGYVVERPVPPSAPQVPHNFVLVRLPKS